MSKLDRVCKCLAINSVFDYKIKVLSCAYNDTNSVFTLSTLANLVFALSPYPGF